MTSDNMTTQEEMDYEGPEVDGETKSEKWKRLANFRLNHAIKRLRMFQTLNSAAYEYSIADVERLCEILHDEVDDIKVALAGRDTDDIPQL